MIIFASGEALHYFRHQHQIFKNRSQSKDVLENLLHWRFRRYIFLKMFIVCSFTKNINYIPYFVRMLLEIQICYHQWQPPFFITWKLYQRSVNTHSENQQIFCRFFRPFAQSLWKWVNWMRSRLREKCPNTELFLVRIYIRTEKLIRKSPYSFRTQENTDKK